MTTEKEIELKLEHMNEKIDSTAKYILLLIGKIDETTKAQIQTEKENTKIQMQIEKENTEKYINKLEETSKAEIKTDKENTEKYINKLEETTKEQIKADRSNTNKLFYGLIGVITAAVIKYIFFS